MGSHNLPSRSALHKMSAQLLDHQMSQNQFSFETRTEHRPKLVYDWIIIDVLLTGEIVKAMDITWTS
jgi:hypothetical protein